MDTEIEINSKNRISSRISDNNLPKTWWQRSYIKWLTDDIGRILMPVMIFGAIFGTYYYYQDKKANYSLFSNNDPNSRSSSNNFLNDAGGDIQIERVDLYTS